MFSFKFDYHPRELSSVKSDAKFKMTELDMARVGQLLQPKIRYLCTNETEEVGSARV